MTKGFSRRRCLVGLLCIASLLLLSGCQQRRVSATNIEDASSPLLKALFEKSDLPSAQSVYDMVTTQTKETPTPANDQKLEHAYRNIAYYTAQGSFTIIQQWLERYSPGESSSPWTIPAEYANGPQDGSFIPPLPSSLPIEAVKCFRIDEANLDCWASLNYATLRHVVHIANPSGTLSNQEIEEILRKVVTVTDQRIQSIDQ